MLQRNQDPSMQAVNSFTNNNANDSDESSPLLQKGDTIPPLVNNSNHWNQPDSTKSLLVEQSVAQTAEHGTKMKNTTTTTTKTTSTGFSTGFVSFLETASGIRFAIFHVVLFYIVAILAFSFGLEKWSIIDSLYFATITFTSVGYGDITPDTDQGRLFTFFFGLYGIFILGFFAGIVGEKVVTAHNEASRSRESQASNRVKTMFNNPPSTNDNNFSSFHAMASSSSSPQSPPQLSSILWKLLRMELPLILTVMILGIGYGVFVEGWTVIQSIYFAGITASTVGYGDFSPSSPLSRLLCVVLIPLCVVIFCNVVGHIATAYLQYQGMVQEQQFLQRQLSFMDLNRMDSNHDGQVEWGEFLSFMLVALQKVDEDDISELRDVFDRLDVNKTGKLDKQDLRTTVQGNNSKNKITIDC